LKGKVAVHWGKGTEKEAKEAPPRGGGIPKWPVFTVQPEMIFSFPGLSGGKSSPLGCSIGKSNVFQQTLGKFKPPG